MAARLVKFYGRVSETVPRKLEERTSEAMSSSPEYCLHVSLSMMFRISGSISESGAYKALF